MLIVHEVHSVDGRHGDGFDDLWRDEWIPAVGAADDPACCTISATSTARALRTGSSH
jgi:hypothetical protein